MLETNVTKIGGSLYILIPAYVVSNLKLKSGDLVLIKIIDDEEVIFILQKEGKNDKNAVHY